MSVYEHSIANEWRWKIDGERRLPTYDDVKLLVEDIIKQVAKSPTSISVEIGGILVKRTDDYVDVYLFAGGIKR